MGSPKFMPERTPLCSEESWSANLPSLRMDVLCSLPLGGRGRKSRYSRRGTSALSVEDLHADKADLLSHAKLFATNSS